MYENKSMKIMFLTNYYFPEVGASSYLYQELSQSLLSMGHHVTVVTGFPRYNVRHVERKYRKKYWLRENIDGVEVLRMRTPGLPKYIPVARGLEYLFIGICLFIRAMSARRPDVVLVYSPPLFLGLSAMVLRILKRVPFVFNVHDLFPQTAIDLGMLKNPFLIRLFHNLEKYLYQKADWITVHSSGNRDWVVAHGGNNVRSVVMPIWMDVNKLKPGPRNNIWRHRQGLDNKTVVLFAGTLGFNQDVEIILKAACRLRNHQDLEFVIIGDGAQKVEMMDKSRQMELVNIRWLDWQPRDEFHLVMHTADIALATLKEEVSTPVVPSKILSAMSAGCPVITCMPMEGDAPKLVMEANSGIALPPGDDAKLSEAILRLRNDRTKAEKLGANGRRYVEHYLDVSHWAEEYIKLFSKLIPDKKSVSISIESLN